MMVLHVFLGTAVVGVGFWLLWETVSPPVVLSWAFLAAGFLWWKGRSIVALWAWTTLILGLESFARPAVLMVRLKSGATPPSEEDMESVLAAIVLGLFSSVFWISFSYGLFKRAGAPANMSPSGPPSTDAEVSAAKRKPAR